MAAGTAAGGWRIIRTLGHQDGETAAGPWLRRGNDRRGDHSSRELLRHSAFHDSRHFHVDYGRRRGETFQRSEWTVVERIVWAWLFTLPASGLIGYVLERTVRAL